MLNKRKKRRRLLLIAVIILSIIVIMLMFNRENILPKYIEPETESVEESLDVEYEVVAPITDQNFRISFPKGMQKVEDNDNVYYLSDYLNISVKKRNYTSEISLYDSQQYLNTLSGNITMMSFNYPTTSSLLTSYRRKTETSEYIIVDFSVWDRKNIIDISYEIDSSIYEKYLPIIRESIDSYTWESEFSIQPNLYMAYNEYGNCDFAIPLGFEDKSTSSMYAYENSEGTIYTTLEIFENDAYLDNISNIGYVQYAGNNKQGFTLINYTATKEEILAESYYTDQNTKETIYMYQKIVANGTKQYFITYYVSQNVLNDNVLELIEDAFSYFALR